MKLDLKKYFQIRLVDQMKVNTEREGLFMLFIQMNRCCWNFIIFVLSIIRICLLLKVLAWF